VDDASALVTPSLKFEIESRVECYISLELHNLYILLISHTFARSTVIVLY